MVFAARRQRAGRAPFGALVLLGAFFALSGYEYWVNRDRQEQDDEEIDKARGASLDPVAHATGDPKDWPQWRGANRDGFAPGDGLLDDWPEDGPPVVWRVKGGGGFSSMAVAAGRLVTMVRDGDDEEVLCLDAETGKERWRFPLGDTLVSKDGSGPRSTPTIDGDRVYALGSRGVLCCLRLGDGKKLWDADLKSRFDAPLPAWGFACSPLVDGKLLLLSAGGPGGQSVVALDKMTGETKWTALDDPAGYSSPVAATIDGERHAIFFTRQGLLSLDPAKGTVRFSKRWRSRFDASVNAATPIVAGDQIFLSACYDTGAILLKATKSKVEEVWQSNDALLCHFGTPVLVEGHLYGFDGRQEEGARLRCIELKSGKVCWTKDDFGCGSILAVPGMLIVLSEGGELVLVEPTPSGYKEKARATVLSKPCRSTLALADGRLYARDGKKLVCWDLKK